MIESPVMTYEEAMAALRCGKTKLKELLRYGQLVKAERVGKEGLVTRASVEIKLQRMAGVKPARPRRSRREPPPGVRLARVPGSVGRRDD